MSSSAASLNYRPDIDGLRAVAVVSVVLHHAFPNWVEGGFIGVDVFFVISGYLISSIIFTGLEKQQFSFSDFYVRRIRRIFPALLLVMTTVLAVGWFRLLPVDYELVGKHVIAGSTFLSNFVLWGEAGYFDVVSANKPLLHLWSLAIEEQFYMLWPLALWIGYRWNMNTRAWIGMMIVASFLLSLYLVTHDVIAAFYNPLARFWELMIGALLAATHIRRGILVTHPHKLRNPDTYCSSTIPLTRWSNPMAWAGVLMLVGALLSVKPDSLFPGGWALLPTLGTALVIAAGPSAWVNRHLLASRPFVGIGLISYPLYLWHWPLLAFSNIEASGDQTWEFKTGWVLASMLLAWMTFLLVERPIRLGSLNRRLVTCSLWAVMGLAASAGLATYHNDGFDHRFPELVRVLMSKTGREAISEGWRTKDCMLNYRTPPSHYKPSCIEKKRPLIFVWGDSHAGSMYPGFKALQNAGKYQFGLGERAASICPSILGIDPRQLCRITNDSNIQAIRDSKPDVVILYSKWHHKRYDLRNLPATVQEIKKAGVPRIILLGAVPYWKKDLPQILLEEWKRGPVQARPPLRLGDEFLDPEVRNATKTMRALSKDMDIEFISGLDFFCDVNGCLTRIADDAQQPLTYDYGHLSTGAMEYYVERLAPHIFKNTP